MGLGLLLLGPVIVNIVAFHVFVAGDGVKDPMVIAVCALLGFLVLVEHRAWLGLLKRPLPGGV